MINIALAGGPSCGKTSLARYLTTRLYNEMEPKRNAQHVTEFARDFINECRQVNGGHFHPKFADQQIFFREQLRREKSLPPTVEFMITDSPIFLTLIYAFTMVDPKDFQNREWYLKLYEEWLTSYVNHYDHIFILERENEFFKDGTRGGTEKDAEHIHNKIIGFLNFHNIPFEYISGNDKERVDKVLELIL